jgi:atypical dual specificity phosphatase
MSEPPPYPRTPHLWLFPGRTARYVLPTNEVDLLLQEPATVEEKVDGANVVIWYDEHDLIRVASRGGPDAMDRAHQLGPVRAWTATQHGLPGLLHDGWVLYGEWMWLTHGVSYDALPDWLICLDLWHSEMGFAPVPERDQRCREAGLVLPPTLFEGVPQTRERLLQLLGRSRLSSTACAEGLVLRGRDGKRAKLLSAGHHARTDDSWRGAPQHNRLEAPHAPDPEQDAR